jgi:hypothetical protein
MTRDFHTATFLQLDGKGVLRHLPLRSIYPS